MIPSSEHNWFMGLAIEEARGSIKKNEVPIGAVVVDSAGNLLSKSSNHKESRYLPCGHAEIIALNEAGALVKNWRLTGATLYVTLEPCPMCFFALVNARLSTIVFGSYDAKGGALSLGYHFHKDMRLNHRFNVIGGIRHFECSKMLSDFFKERRLGYHQVI